MLGCSALICPSSNLIIAVLLSPVLMVVPGSMRSPAFSARWLLPTAAVALPVNSWT